MHWLLPVLHVQPALQEEDAQQSWPLLPQLWHPLDVHTSIGVQAWPCPTHVPPAQQPLLQLLPAATQRFEPVSQHEGETHALLAQHCWPAMPQCWHPAEVHTMPALQSWPCPTHVPPAQHPLSHEPPAATHRLEPVSQHEGAAHAPLAQHCTPAVPQLSHPFEVHTWPATQSCPWPTHVPPEQQPLLQALPTATHWCEPVSQQKGAVQVSPEQHALPAMPHMLASGVKHWPMRHTSVPPQLCPAWRHEPFWQHPVPHWALASQPPSGGAPVSASSASASSASAAASAASLAWSR